MGLQMKQAKEGTFVHQTKYTKNIEGPKRRTSEEGSQWEPIKILLKNASFFCQVHVATGVLLDLEARHNQ
jgi:hypothetical protein